MVYFKTLSGQQDAKPTIAKAIFFFALLPQFVVEGAGPVWAQLFLHGIPIIVAAGTIEHPLVIAGEKLTSKLRHNPYIGRWMDGTSGAIFFVLNSYKL